MENSVTFIMPFVFTNRKDLELSCAGTLYKQIKDNSLYNLYISCHKDNTEFKKIKFPTEIKTILLEKQYSISEAINAAAKNLSTEYFCFIHSDLFFQNNNWINDVIEIYKGLDKPGIIGIQHHLKSFFYKPINNNINQVIWSDGIMFFKSKLFNEIGFFDENYFADCESQDFSYKVIKSGYKNYLIEPNFIKANHIQTNGFSGKSSDQNFINLVLKSRQLLKTTWGENFHEKYAKTQLVN